MIGASFLVRARECLDQLPGIAHIDVQLQHDCDWTPNDLEPAYAQRLHDRRAAQQRMPMPPRGPSHQPSD
jgi:hypothetical protein